MEADLYGTSTEFIILNGLSEFTATFINLLTNAHVLAPNAVFQLCNAAPHLDRWLSTTVLENKRIPKCFTNILLAF